MSHENEPESCESITVTVRSNTGVDTTVEVESTEEANVLVKLYARTQYHMIWVEIDGERTGRRTHNIFRRVKVKWRLLKTPKPTTYSGCPRKVHWKTHHDAVDVRRSDRARYRQLRQAILLSITKLAYRSK